MENIETDTVDLDYALNKVFYIGLRVSGEVEQHTIEAHSFADVIYWYKGFRAATCPSLGQVELICFVEGSNNSDQDEES